MTNENRCSIMVTTNKKGQQIVENETIKKEYDNDALESIRKRLSLLTEENKKLVSSQIEILLAYQLKHQ